MHILHFKFSSSVSQIKPYLFIHFNLITKTPNKSQKKKHSTFFFFFFLHIFRKCLKEYILITTPMTWYNSQSYCRQHYHDLAMIETSAENQAVTNLLSTTTTSVWIGLYRTPWRWSNGSTSTYRKWSTGEPNNNGGSEFCGSQSSSLEWNDAACTILGYFVCQRGILRIGDRLICFFHVQYMP
uniref:C-type lectin domain-containing protein n=1 Tax=Periophthalmus magnuspinnatus TaxID=409849 RepID=A0A3B4AA29_9GOBI